MDKEAISTLITEAFFRAEHSAGNEAKIVEGLREAQSLAVSLVAIEDDGIVGHVAFSQVTVNGQNCGWFGLGPVASVPSRQRQGIGSALIEAGLEVLRTQGASGCVVLGEPAYYGRFGFIADAHLRLEGVPPACFQQLTFDDQPCAGVVKYHPAFEST